MKKITTIILAVLISALIVSACASAKDKTQNKTQNTTGKKQEHSTDSLETVTESEAGETDQHTEAQADDRSEQKTSAAEDSASSESTSDNIWFFESTDLAGNNFNSQDYFAKGNLTLVNVWATWCPPCRAELPDLGKLARDFAGQKVQFLGIATDVFEDDQEILDVANSLLADSAVEYPNIKINKQINEIMLQNQIQSIPTTILIDPEGNVIGDFIVGMRSYDDFSNLINSALDQAK
ncbi:MAG: TlpA family protein disulfide reductase [Saccharofermentanales bacterium]|jgi:thiol-disulfide isomerase/thioredoxin